MAKAARGISFLYCAAAYLSALAAGIAVFHLFGDAGVWIAMFLADIAATVAVWLCGLIAGNASLYDPYWSVAPLVILPAWLLVRGTSPGLSGVLFLIAVYGWGLRLTYNWANRWQGIGHQDWRYTMLKGKNPGMWFLTNLAGINLMPTVLVYLGMTPAYLALYADRPVGLLSWAGFAVCVAAAAIQAVADRQMEDFKKSDPPEGRYINTGLWRLSRHPNYLGEVCFWWGIWLMQTGIAPLWWTVIGPAAISALFVFVSIPMMERHVAGTRPGYAAYKREVPMLAPIRLRRKMTSQ